MWREGKEREKKKNHLIKEVPVTDNTDMFDL